MIIGIGVDQVSIKRIEEILQKHPDRFLKRLFTPQEIHYCESAPLHRAARYAKRFAAKEACVKAAGVGYRDGVSWQDMCVTSSDLGQPLVHLQGKLLGFLEDKAGNRPLKAHLSLTDTDQDATAFVIIETVPRP